MSAIIARKTDAGFVGREYQGPGDPSELGRTLWTFYHQRYAGSLPEMLADVLDRFPAEIGLRDIVQAKQVNETTPGRFRWCYCFATVSGLDSMEVLYRSENGWSSLGHVYLERAEPNWYTYEALASSLILPATNHAAKGPATPVQVIDDLAQAIEARAQARGDNAPIWFISRYGLRELLHPDGNGAGWMLSSTVPVWGVVEFPVPSRLRGICIALLSGSKEQEVIETPEDGYRRSV